MNRLPLFHQELQFVVACLQVLDGPHLFFGIHDLASSLDLYLARIDSVHLLDLFHGLLRSSRLRAVFTPRTAARFGCWSYAYF